MAVDRGSFGRDLESSSEADRDFDKDIFEADNALDANLKAILELGHSVIEAERILLDYASKEAKIATLLQCPQSSDKHAEGPLIKDHYRCILIALEVIKRGLLDSSKVPECLEMKGYEQEWDAVIEFIKENPDLMLIFALSHDLGKEDFVGFYAKKSMGQAEGFPDKRTFHQSQRDKMLSSKDRKRLKQKYTDLYNKFATQHPDIPEADVQQKFFDMYGLSVTYIGHEKGLSIPENRAVTDRLIVEKGLDRDEAQLLDYSVLHHVSNYMDFGKGPADYDGLFMAAREAGIDPIKGIRSLQAGVVIDGILGARKRREGADGLFIATETMRKFFDAERAHPQYIKDREAKEAEAIKNIRIKHILIAERLGGKDIVELGIPATARAKIIEAIYIAVGGSGELQLPEGGEGLLADDVREVLNDRVRAAHLVFLTEKS